jgi:hypothetical protein
VEQILGDGAASAARIAGETLRQVKDRMGFLPARNAGRESRVAGR